MKRTLILLIVALLLCLSVTAWLFFYGAPQESQQQAERYRGVAVLGGDFTLTSHTGETVTQENLLGKLSLVYFGFSYCPDICPEDLQKITTVLNTLPEEKAAQVQPVFISVDPERDTPETLANYITLYHPSFLALTGTPEQIQNTADKYRVYYRRVEMEGATEYLVDHSALIYFMDKEGNYIDFFRHDASVQEIVEKINEYIILSQ